MDVFPTDSTLKIIPLGGLGEIGLNMALFEYGEDIIIIDCGLMFPEPYMLGIDLVIPDISYLLERADRIRGLFLTHGHEDHIGAIPFLLRDINPPIYGTALTLGFVREKLKEFRLDEDACLNVVRPRQKVQAGCFEVEFIRVAHSIVDGCGLAIGTPEGVVIHTGDFKIDQTPVDGELTDLVTFARYGEEGVLALMSDSTNVEREGYTLSEKLVGDAFDEIFPQCGGRIIVAAFSSNIHRVQQVVDAAARWRRKVLLNGRSMVANVQIARDLGYLRIPDDLLIDLRDLPRLPKEEVCMITTGSQGEPMSALTRIAMDDHKQIRLEAGDTVILSSRFIPGNERTISDLINHLYRRGAEVYHEKVSEVHVSGHASQEELKLMLNMVRPRYFIPVHGEYRHLVKHAQLAQKVGIGRDNCILAVNGDVITFSGGRGWIDEGIETGRVFVDGKGIGDVGEIVLKDRRHLSQDGLVIVIIGINQATGEIIYGPDIVSRGFVFEDESQEFLDETRKTVLDTLAAKNVEVLADWNEVKQEVRRVLRRFFNKTLERRPVILPLILEM
ncbi:ribonuclease J [Geobacter sp. DSM 9736]|uniref:ribonuclease J n=1 Tax=Geobacter sp. DSM 9736 TaxID=1277350 RepID=UPI000B507205|nr:ribonuclease J [Geobacter sp. DSM 9736]